MGSSPTWSRQRPTGALALLVFPIFFHVYCFARCAIMFIIVDPDLEQEREEEEEGNSKKLYVCCTRRRWIRTTGMLLPLGFEVQALNPQSSSAQNCRVWGSNSRPLDYETNALPTEPTQHNVSDHDQCWALNSNSKEHRDLLCVTSHLWPSG